MKLALVFGSVVFLIAGITLASYSLEVTAQSMGPSTSLLNLTSSNVTASVMEKAKNVQSNLPNATEGGLKKYENPKYGLSFLYPSEWKEPRDLCKDPLPSQCGPLFTISEAAPESDGVVVIGVDVVELDKPKDNDKPCNCNTLKEFVAWDYTRSPSKLRTFVNDNQTVIGKNYSGWQTETTTTTPTTTPLLGAVTMKSINDYAINGDLGYRFGYTASPPDPTFDRYLEGFKNMLKTVTFTPPTPEKKPSFLNSTQLPNSSGVQSAPATTDNSVKILSSNDFIDSVGYLHVVGEVENNTPTNAQFVKVTGTFYDTNNQVVATDFTYTNPSDIGPGGKAPFDLTLLSASIPVSQIDHYNLIASYQ